LGGFKVYQGLQQKKKKKKKRKMKKKKRKKKKKSITSKNNIINNDTKKKQHCLMTIKGTAARYYLYNESKVVQKFRDAAILKLFLSLNASHHHSSSCREDCNFSL
jgi:hypothetical protein